MRLQLTEKQKVKFVYGMLEKQFRAYYEQALHVCPARLARTCWFCCERRLDNVVFRARLRPDPPRGPSAGEPWPFHRQRQEVSTFPLTR